MSDNALFGSDWKALAPICDSISLLQASIVAKVITSSARAIPHEIRFLDLFSGCGGMSWGFKSAGLIPVAGVEILKDPADSYFANLGVPGYCTRVSGFVDDCKTFLSSGQPADYWSTDFSESLCLGIDVLIGGPPCQGYSALGRMSRKSDRVQIHSMLNDLWNDFLDAVHLFRPRAVVVENVPLFGKSQGFSQFINRLNRLDYQVISEVLNAADYGVPQVRKRLFTIAIKDTAPTFPAPSQSKLNVRDAIGNLALEPDGTNWHVGRRPTAKSKERYRVIPPGGNRFDLMKIRPDITPRCWLDKPTGTTDVFGRLHWDQPSSTIRTEFFKPEKGRYLHPVADRPITHREAAFLQSFPGDYMFVGGNISVARQIGEAVPPELARRLGIHLLQLISPSPVGMPAAGTGKHFTVNDASSSTN